MQKVICWCASRRACFAWLASASLLLQSLAAQQVAPVLLGEWPGHPRQAATQVVLHENRAFLILTNSGFGILDISSPTAPSPLGGYAFSGTCRALAVSGNYAFMAAEGSAAGMHRGLNVLDVSDPRRVRRIARHATNSVPRSLAISGDNLLLSVGAQFQILDISKPESPQVTIILTNFPPVDDMAVAGDLAYLAAGVAGLIVLDLADPSNPQQVATLKSRGAFQIETEGEVAVILDSADGLVVLDTSDPSEPKAVGAYPTRGGARLELHGGHAYLARLGGIWAEGLQIFDVTTPANPRLVGAVQGRAYDVAVAGNHAFVPGYVQDTRVIDITNPSQPIISAVYDSLGDARNVTLNGNIAYLADGTAGIQILDVSNLGLPRRLARQDTPGEAFDVALSENRAFVADGAAGIQLLDVTDPSSPLATGSYTAAGPAHGITIARDHLFLAADFRGVSILSMTNRAALQPRSSFYSFRSREIAVAGNYAFVAQSTNLQVYDISEPAHPTNVAAVLTSSSVHGVMLWREYALVPNDSAGLHIIDISDPLHPTTAGRVRVSAPVIDVAVLGNLAVLLEAAKGLQFVDLTDPRNPRLVGSYPLSAKAVEVSGSRIYVAGTTGLTILTIPPELAFSHNSATGSLTLSLTSLASATITIETSPDLVGWTPLLTTNMSSGRSISLAVDADGGKTFFRARQ